MFTNSNASSIDVEPPSWKSYQIVDGFPIPALISLDSYRSALNYKPRPDDVFVATYPKCGTTWVQQILLLIFRQGQPLESFTQFFAMTPYLEMSGAEGAENMPRPGAMKVHLPYHLIPRSDKAKYIYVTRNPKDCCVSYFHHMKSNFAIPFTGTFDEFFEIFMAGKIDYGDYFDHLSGWYAHRNDSNVLFLTYEQIKEKTEETILKIASFIDDKLYWEPLRNDPEKLKNVIKYSSFDYMKSVINKGLDDMFSTPLQELLKSDLPSQMKDLLSNVSSASPGIEAPEKIEFIRKGIIGDWKNYFSEEQTERLDEKFTERTKGTDIPTFWSKYM